MMTGAARGFARINWSKKLSREIGEAQSQTCKLVEHATVGQEQVTLSLIFRWKYGARLASGDWRPLPLPAHQSQLTGPSALMSLTRTKAHNLSKDLLTALWASVWS